MRFLLFILIVLINVKSFSQSSAVVSKEISNSIHIASLEIIPHIYLEESGNATGVLYDLINFVGAESGVPIKFSVVPWPRALEGAKTGVYDAITPTIQKKEREADLSFTKPITKFDIALFNNVKNAKYNGKLESLLNSKIARIINQSGGVEFDNFILENKIEVVESKIFEQSIKLLEFERVKYALIPVLTGISIVNKEGISGKIEYSKKLVNTVDIYVAFTRSQNAKAELYKKFNKTLSKLISNGVLVKKEKELLTKYKLNK